jgi:hypothetical protein
VEPDRTDALIGTIVMEDMDFLVDCTHQTIDSRDPDAIVTEVESITTLCATSGRSMMGSIP